jgi:hypothetical protein
MTDNKFRLPGSSYDELCKIIKAYGRYDRAVSNEEISQLTGLNETMFIPCQHAYGTLKTSRA